MRLQLPAFDQEQQREHYRLEDKLTEVAVRDSRFQPWWEIYRNHHKRPVIVLPHRQEGEGAYLWHFHITRCISAEDKEELLPPSSSRSRSPLRRRNVDKRRADCGTRSIYGRIGSGPGSLMPYTWHW